MVCLQSHLAWACASGGSSPAPGPECSLRLEKVSKVAPLRESKLTSEGLFRPLKQAGEADCRGEPAAKHTDALPTALNPHCRVESAVSHVLSETMNPTRLERSAEGRGKIRSCLKKRWANFAACGFSSTLGRTSLPMSLLGLGSEGPEPRHGEAITTSSPDPDVHGRPVDPTAGPKERTKGRTTVNEGQISSPGKPAEQSSHTSASQLESLR